MYDEILILILAIILDLVMVEPPEAIHPVVWSGRLIGFFDSKWRRQKIDFAAGTFFTLVVVTFALILSLLPFLLPHPLSPIISAYFLFSCISIRSMVEHAKATISNGIDSRKVQMIVSRDTRMLNSNQLCSAVIESIAENFVDGVFAPLLYFSIFGLPGAMVYRAINVCDAMIGYKTPEYEKFGKFAARLDDVANFLPARISVLLFALLNPASLKAYRHTVKLNGHAMVAMAYTLGVSLEKPGCYSIDAGREPDEKDIEKATSVFWKLSFMTILLSTALLL